MAKLIVILGFLLSFAAGIVIGSRSGGLVDPAPASPAPPTTAPAGRPGLGGWLTRELGLMPEQRKQLDDIWSAIASRGRGEYEDRRREYRRERDTAIADLVPPARMGEYDHIVDAYTERLSALDRDSREAYDAAVERTRQILTPEQRTHYEELLKRHRWGPAVRDRHAGRRSETRATSQPAERNNVSSPSHESLKGAL